MSGGEAPKSTLSADLSATTVGDGAILLDYDPSSPFQCCVCLDLLYKPIVLACGHISCFWCVHKAMHGLRASHCAICRQPYYHFPGICQLLHFLFLKLEPVAYKRRQMEILEQEKQLDTYSPQFLDASVQDKVNLEDASVGQSSEASNSIAREHVSSSVNGLQKKEYVGVSVNDVLCCLCKEMLYQPAVLNCGHVYCESCLSGISAENIRCQVCQILHPGGFPNICLDLDHFLEKQFPCEYKLRRERVMHKMTQCQHAKTSSCVICMKNENGKVSCQATGGHLLLNEPFSNVHFSVGCDSCGMYPIVGKRYRCKDCKEAIGFDLCEACYNTASKLPGRFNQQHTPDHQFELDNSRIVDRMFRLRTLIMEDIQQYIPDDVYLPLADIEEQNIQDNVSEGSGDGDEMI